MRLARFGWVVCLLLWGRAALAENSPPRVALEVTRGAGTESCIDGATLERSVELRLKRSVFDSSGAAGLRIALRVDRARGGAWTAKLALRDRRGNELGARELVTRAAHCSALDDSVALVVALLVDSPEAQASANAEPPAPTIAEPPAKNAGPSGSAPSAPPLRTAPLELPASTYAPREPYRVEVGAGALVAFGVLPGAALGAALSLGLRAPQFMELRLRPAVFPSSRVEGPTSDRGGRFSLFLLGVDLCPLEHGTGRLRVSACVGQSVGGVRAAGFGFRRSESTLDLYYALGASLVGAWWLLPPLGLTLELAAVAPLARPTYLSLGPAGERREMFRAGPVAGSAGVGVLLSL